MATSPQVALRLDRALRNAGLAIEGVSIGDLTDKATWRVFPASLQGAADQMIASFDPDSQTVIDTEISTQSTLSSRAKDVLATIAWVIRSKDPVAWSGLTGAQKRTQVFAEADNWRDIRIFIEKNL